jgi:hypothetical protein
MKLGDYIPAYRKRRIEADKKRRAVIVEEQLQAERKRDKLDERADNQQIVVALQRINHQQHAYAEQQKRDDDRRDSRERRRFWLDVAALIIASIAALILFGQQKAMQGQLEEMRTDKRAWIEVASIDPNNLTIADMGLSINVIFRLRNSGHTPAIEVASFPKIIPTEGLQVLARMEKEQCGISHHQTTNLPSTRDIFYKRTIFPTSEAISAGGYGAGISTNEIVEARMREFNLHERRPFGKVTVLGCIDYDSMDIHRQTGFIAICGMRGQPTDNPDATGPFALANIGTIPNDQWHCVLEPGGTFAK